MTHLYKKIKSRAKGPLEGWGEDPKRIEALIRDDPEALEMWRGEVVGRPGGDKRSGKTITNNVMNDAPLNHGNAKPYTLDRLKRKAPDMFQAVCNGELSAKPHT